MEAAEVAVHECVTRLRVVGGPFGEPEVPLAVLISGVRGKVRGLICRSRLNLAPVAVQHILTALDQSTRPSDGALIEGVRSHLKIVTPTGPLSSQLVLGGQSVFLRARKHDSAPPVIR
jgi:hypothetical protein